MSVHIVYAERLSRSIQRKPRTSWKKVTEEPQALSHKWRKSTSRSDTLVFEVSLVNCKVQIYYLLYLYQSMWKYSNVTLKKIEVPLVNCKVQIYYLLYLHQSMWKYSNVTLICPWVRSQKFITVCCMHNLFSNRSQNVKCCLVIDHHHMTGA